jgi:hypothetical protein
MELFKGQKPPPGSPCDPRGSDKEGEHKPLMRHVFLSPAIFYVGFWFGISLFTACLTVVGGGLELQTGIFLDLWVLTLG